MIRECVKEFINKYNLKGTFILAFSGGYDSMCLLDILKKLNSDVVAVHLNHNWRGQESLKEAQNCENFAKSIGVKFYSEVLPDNIKKTETDARQARYEFFKRCAEKFNSNIIFTAHNYNDNAETVFYRIIRGTGIAGIAGIAEHRDIYYRPLLKITREEIERYCRENNLQPNIDSSNFNIKYKRNYIRREIFPLLSKINPRFIDSLNSLSCIATDFISFSHKHMPYNILDASEEEQKFILGNKLLEMNIEYDRKKIEKIQKFICENKNSKSGKKMSITENLWLFVNNNKAEFITNTEKNNTEIKIEKCGSYKFEDYTFTIKPYTNKVAKYPEDNEYKAYVNISNIDFTLRHRKDGDRIQPLGLSGSQKLKKYLNEKKIPQHEKDKIIFLCHNNEILWAAGYGISEKIKTLEHPTHVLTLEKR